MQGHDTAHLRHGFNLQDAGHDRVGREMALEIRFVERDKLERHRVFPRIDPHHLLWVLESLVRGEVVNRIVVPPEDKEWALVALNRMLEIA